MLSRGCLQPVRRSDVGSTLGDRRVARCGLLADSHTQLATQSLAQPARLKGRVPPNVTLFSGPPDRGATAGAYGWSVALKGTSPPTSRVSVGVAEYYDPTIVQVSGLTLNISGDLLINSLGP
jgi:hypothetical protein